MTKNEIIIEYINQRKDSKNIVFVLLQGGATNKKNIDFTKTDLDLLIGYNNEEDFIDEHIYLKENGNYIDNYKNIMFDYRCIFLNSVRNPKSWKERVRYIWLHETEFIYGDEEQYNKLKNEVKMSKLEQKELIIHGLLHSLSKGISFTNDNLITKISVDKYSKIKTYWEDKGEPVFGIIFKMRALEYIELVIFALNGEFMPSPKRRNIIARDLNWLPKDYNKMLEEYTKNPIEAIKLMNNVLEECQKKAVELGLYENLTKYIFKSKLYCISKEIEF